MMDLAIPFRDAAKFSRRRSIRPVLEGLEDRMLLYAVTGDHFTYGSRITWSIMPDGTNLGGIPSNFVSTMNQKLGAGNWMNAINDAFAEWEDVANVNFAQVPDNGAPFGSGNYQQGSPEFGDIRIGGLGLSSGTLALTLLPPPANGGSDAGDVLFNTNQTWHINSDYDLESVAIHEIGHTLGLGHSTDINAVMYPYYGGVEQSPNTDDINGVQSIWRPRQEDPFVVNTGNLTSARAADVTSFMNTSSNQVYLPGLNVVNSSEGYWFKVTTPANTSGTLTAQVQSTNLSELSPRVQIYNASLQGLVQLSAPMNAYGTTIAVSTSVTPNTTYYIKVLASNASATGSGAYAMTLNMGKGSIALSPPPNTVVAAQPDQGAGTLPSKRAGVETLVAGTVGGLIKEWARSVEGMNPTPFVGEFDNSLTKSINDIAGRLTASGDLTNGAFDAALTAVLQEMPTGFLDESSSDLFVPGQGHGKKSAASPLLTQFLLAIKSSLFSDGN